MLCCLPCPTAAVSVPEMTRREQRSNIIWFQNQMFSILIILMLLNTIISRYSTTIFFLQSFYFEATFYLGATATCGLVTLGWRNLYLIEFLFTHLKLKINHYGSCTNYLSFSNEWIWPECAEGQVPRCGGDNIWARCEVICVQCWNISSQMLQCHSLGEYDEV